MKKEKYDEESDIDYWDNTDYNYCGYDHNDYKDGYNYDDYKDYTGGYDYSGDYNVKSMRSGSNLYLPSKRRSWWRRTVPSRSR